MALDSLPQAARPLATRRDDEERFTQLIAPHVAAMQRVAAALVGSADAEDAAQEAITRGWQAWATLRSDEALRAWLLRITVNVCHDWQRGRFGTRRRLTEPLPEGDNAPPFALPGADPGASDHAAALDLRHALYVLDDDLRLIVALRYFGGMDATEIGLLLGTPPATIRTRLRRALHLMRTSLAGYGYGPAKETVAAASRQRAHG